MERRPLLLLALTALAAMTAFGLTLPTMAFLAQDFGASDFQVGLLPACYFGLQFFFAPVWGAASDRIGRKPLLAMGLFGFAASFAISGFLASSLWALYGAMLLAGLLGSATLPAIRAAVADVTSDAARGRGMGLIGACIGLGFVFGPGLAFGLIHGLGGGEQQAPAAMIGLHQLPFRMAAGVALAATLLLVPFLPLPRPVRAAGSAPARRHPGGFAALATALRGPLTRVYLAALLSTFALAALEASLPLFVRFRFEAAGVLPASWLARAFVVMGITGVVVQGGLVSRLIAGMGEVRTAAVGLLFAAIGYGSVPLFSHPDLVLVPLVILAVGTGLVRPSIATLISRRSAAAGQGGAIGSLDSFESFGRATGNPTGGALHGMAPFAPFAAAAFVALAALIPLLAAALPAFTPQPGPDLPLPQGEGDA